MIPRGRSCPCFPTFPKTSRDLPQKWARPSPELWPNMCENTPFCPRAAAATLTASALWGRSPRFLGKVGFYAGDLPHGNAITAPLAHDSPGKVLPLFSNLPQNQPASCTHRTPIYNFWPFFCTFVYATAASPAARKELFFRAVPEKPIPPLRTSFVTLRSAALRPAVAFPSPPPSPPPSPFAPPAHGDRICHPLCTKPPHLAHGPRRRP